MQDKWKVGRTQSTQGVLESRYCFSIQNEEGAPLLTICYAAEAEARAAENAIRRALKSAVDIIEAGGKQA